MSVAKPVVGIIMGSRSDWPTLKARGRDPRALDVPYETRVVSAHRTPERLYAYANTARKRGLKVIIAGAGGAAHLPGMTASMTALPVLGVPIESQALKGLDSLFRSSRCRPAFRSERWRSARRERPTPGCSRRRSSPSADPELAARVDAWRAAQTDAMPRRSRTMR